MVLLGRLFYSPSFFSNTAFSGGQESYFKDDLLNFSGTKEYTLNDGWTLCLFKQ
jgi:hypothetical protein